MVSSLLESGQAQTLTLSTQTFRISYAFAYYDIKRKKETTKLCMVRKSRVSAKYIYAMDFFNMCDSAEETHTRKHTHIS